MFPQHVIGFARRGGSSFRHGRVAAGLLVAFITNGVAVAQSNDESNSQVQLDFSTPGARSLGMGGSFVAVADDATAAYSNPAGLAQLFVGGSEVSAEYRRWAHKSEIPVRGHSGGDPSGIGFDTIEGVETEISRSVVDGLSFVSFGYPVARRVVVAVFRHELAKFEGDFASEGIFVGTPPEVGRVNPTQSIVDLGITGFGAAVGVGVNEKLALGAGVTYFDSEFHLETRRFEPASRTGNPVVDRQPGGFFGLPDFLGDNVFSNQRIAGSDSDWGYGAGALYSFDEHWRAGVVYRSGADFDIEGAFTWGPRAGSAGRGVPGERVETLGGLGEFRVPDLAALGASYRTGNRRTVYAVDVKHVRYSRLTREVMNIITVASPEDRFLIDDGTELHLGGEHLLVEPGEGGLGRQFAVTVRAGAWLDPDHRLRYEGDTARLRARFPAGQDEWHFTAGLGLIRGENFELDGSFDYSERISTMSLSLIKFL